VNDRRRRGFLPAIVSIVDILSGAAPLMVDVRQTGSGPQGGRPGLASAETAKPVGRNRTVFVEMLADVGRGPETLAPQPGSQRLGLMPSSRASSLGVMVGNVCGYVQSWVDGYWRQLSDWHTDEGNETVQRA